MNQDLTHSSASETGSSIQLCTTNSTLLFLSSDAGSLQGSLVCRKARPNQIGGMKLRHTLPNPLPLSHIEIEIDIELGFGQPWTEDPEACDKGVVVFQVANMATEVCLRRLPVLLSPFLSYMLASWCSGILVI